MIFPAGENPAWQAGELEFDLLYAQEMCVHSDQNISQGE
jgi:hypothetical protein